MSLVRGVVRGVHAHVQLCWVCINWHIYYLYLYFYAWLENTSLCESWKLVLWKLTNTTTFSPKCMMYAKMIQLSFTNTTNQQRGADRHVLLHQHQNQHQHQHHAIVLDHTFAKCLLACKVPVLNGNKCLKAGFGVSVCNEVAAKNHTSLRAKPPGNKNYCGTLLIML